MTDLKRSNISLDKLRKLYKASTTHTLIFDSFATRQRNMRVTKVDRLSNILSQVGIHVNRADLIQFFRDLEAAGCGAFITGRRGHPSRFEWSVGLSSVGRAAAGETGEIEAISDVEQEEDIEEGLETHVYRLRPGLVIKFDLPADLSTSEATRLADFIRTLPIGA